jgi:SH3-like domain-containing protein
MQEEYREVSTNRAAKVARGIAAAVAFLVVVWVIMGIWGSFRRAQTLSAEAQGSATASATAAANASVVTTVTDLSATIRIDVPLRSQPATATAVVAMAREGSTLDVVAKKGTWLRLKDKAGHLGWVPNDAQFLSVKSKVATKATPKKKKK